MSDWLQSISGSPWTIHSAMLLPTAGPSLTQTAAADQRPLTSGVSPSSGMPSGVSAMRPLIAYFTPTDSSPTISGMSVSASSIWGSKSSGRERELGRRQGRVLDRGDLLGVMEDRAVGVRADLEADPVLALVHQDVHVPDDRELDGPRRSVSKRGTGPTSIIWWTAGVSGICAPAISAMIGDQTPQAMTTYSASTVPSVVSTRRIRPPSTPSAGHFGVRGDVRAPSADGACSRQSVPNWRESQTPTPGV